MGIYTMKNLISKWLDYTQKSLMSCSEMLSDGWWKKKKGTEFTPKWAKECWAKYFITIEACG